MSAPTCPRCNRAECASLLHVTYRRDEPPARPACDGEPVDWRARCLEAESRAEEHLDGLNAVTARAHALALDLERARAERDEAESRAASADLARVVAGLGAENMASHVRAFLGAVVVEADAERRFSGECLICRSAWTEEDGESHALSLGTCPVPAARAALKALDGGDGHASDCATHNGPALPVGPCDCSAALPDATEALAAFAAFIMDWTLSNTTVSDDAIRRGQAADLVRRWLEGRR